MALIKSWYGEQGFGVVEHPEHGELLFDFEACDFEPEVGDEVEVLELKTLLDGSHTVGKLIRPAKPS